MGTGMGWNEVVKGVGALWWWCGCGRGWVVPPPPLFFFSLSERVAVGEGVDEGFGV